jgi:hypothetical protein
MKFEITFDDGKKEMVDRKNISQAIDTVPVLGLARVSKVEAISTKLLRLDIHGVNNAFHHYGKTYHSKADIYIFVRDTLEMFNFSDITDKDDLPMEGDEGAIRSYPVGRGVFLTFTWYRMIESGNFEFVGYIS